MSPHTTRPRATSVVIAARCGFLFPSLGRRAANIVEAFRSWNGPISGVLPGRKMVDLGGGNRYGEHVIVGGVSGRTRAGG